MSEFAVRFLVANLAIGAAVLVVLALRAPVRTMFGARLTYAMWLLVPLAGLATLLPPRVEQITTFASRQMFAEFPIPSAPLPPLPPMPGHDGPVPDMMAQSQPAGAVTITRESSGFEMPSPMVLCLIAWLAGVIGMFAWQLRRQSRFVSDAKAGFAGPAVVGVIKPRIVTPADFETTFDANEREMILTHERIHIEGNDARINALAAIAGCICWFNPLVHLGAYFMRIDQELACDASVVSRHPEGKSLYASALLKAQLARAPLPLGCHWPSRSEHPLLQRVAMLGRAEPGRGRRVAGVAVLSTLAIASGVTAWAAIPPERRIIERRADEPYRGDGPTRPAGGQLFLLDGKMVEPVPAPEPQLPAPPPPQHAEPDQNVNDDAKVKASDFRLADLRAQLAEVMQRVDNLSKRYGPTHPSLVKALQDQAYLNRRLRAEEVRLMPQRRGGDAPEPGGSDTDDTIYVRGVVQDIAFGPTSYVVNVRSELLADTPYSVAAVDTRVWTLTPINYFGDEDNKASIIRSLMGKKVDVFGYNAADKSCVQTCRLKTLEIVVRPVTPVMESGFGGLPGRIVLDAVTDNKAPIKLTGTVIRFDTSEESGTPTGVLWVEATSLEPASTPGAKEGTMWRITGFPQSAIQSRFWQGAQVTVNGFNVKDKGCEPACVMVGKQIF